MVLGSWTVLSYPVLHFHLQQSPPKTASITKKPPLLSPEGEDVTLQAKPSPNVPQRSGLGVRMAPPKPGPKEVSLPPSAAQKISDQCWPHTFHFFYYILVLKNIHSINLPGKIRSQDLGHIFPLIIFSRLSEPPIVDYIN